MVGNFLSISILWWDVHRVRGQQHYVRIGSDRTREFSSPEANTLRVTTVFGSVRFAYAVEILEKGKGPNPTAGKLPCQLEPTAEMSAGRHTLLRMMPRFALEGEGARGS